MKLHKYDDEELFYELESRGYAVGDIPLQTLIESANLDDVDQGMLQDIMTKFKNGSWKDRQRFYELIMWESKGEII